MAEFRERRVSSICGFGRTRIPPLREGVMIAEVKDGVESIVKGGRDAIFGRLSIPVLGLFLLSWAACNYRIIFILFSDSR